MSRKINRFFYFNILVLLFLFFMAPAGCGNGDEVSGGICGDGVLNTGEQCDDGNQNNNDACLSNCTNNSNTNPQCGNGVVEDSEACDDGNQSNGDACFTNCTKAPDSSNLKDLNAFCDADAECESGKCMAGYCSECKVDADCPQGGCTLTNNFKTLGAFCNMGEAGAGCQSDEVCADPNNSICGLINVTTELGTISTCGECDTNSDCPMEAPNCTPVYDFHSYSGRKTCVANASLFVGKSCSPDPDVNNNNNPLGDKACASGFCIPAEFAGGIWGECGECRLDSDCDNMEFCNVDGSIITGQGSWGIAVNECVQ